jgi:hypothetical protein
MCGGLHCGDTSQAAAAAAKGGGGAVGAALPDLHWMLELASTSSVQFLTAGEVMAELPRHPSSNGGGPGPGGSTSTAPTHMSVV